LRRQVAIARGGAKRSKAAALAPMDSGAGVLFAKLRAWRAEVAKAHGVPAYVVFHDNTLQAIAQAQPRTIEQLRALPGLGERKLASYGDQLLALVAD
jgi:ATP-dependent DNA helicase RecQ